MSPSTGNLILDSLEPEERAALLSQSRTVPIPVGKDLVRPGDVIEVVRFPTSGALSLIAEPDPDGQSVEAAAVGREGLADAFTALGSRRAAHRLLGQIEGESIDVPVDDFAGRILGDGRFATLVFGFIEALFLQSSVNTACNAIHHVNERCARWLLQSHDRVTSDTFGLKQDFLAIMLGVTRPTVSIAAETLQAAGCISYARGIMTIVDRESLEGAACACYEAIRSEYSRLIPLR